MTTKQKKSLRTVKKSAETGRLSRSEVRAAVVTVHGSATGRSSVSGHIAKTSPANGSRGTPGVRANKNTIGTAGNKAATDGSRNTGGARPTGRKTAEP